MKKIITTIAFALAMISIVSVAHATSFNNDPKDLATVLVGDYTTNPCKAGPADGCWKSSLTAQPGDLVSVQIYYHNTGTTTAKDGAIALNPQVSGPSTTHTFTGAVGADNQKVASGSATIYTTNNETLTFVPGSLRFYPNQSTTPYNISGENYLFSSKGINIDDVAPGWAGQGVLVADYQVSNSYTPPVNNYCYLTLSVDNTSITPGQTTYLRWTSNANGNVYIYPNVGTRSGSGAISISPYSSTTYTMTADNCSQTATAVVNVSQVSNSMPQALTTSAVLLGSGTAQLNGIAIPNTTYGYGSTSAWFQWGSTTSLGYTTAQKNVGNGASNIPYSDVVSGLSSGTTYYYRAVVQNQNGIAYGNIVPFQAPVIQTTVLGTTTYTPPARVVTQTVTRAAVKGTVVAKSAPSLLELRVDSLYDHMCIGGDMQYTVTYHNISNQTLENTVLRIAIPRELTYMSAQRGEYSEVDRTITIALGSVQPGEQGTVVVHAVVNKTAIRGNLTVMTATVVYTNTVTRAQENAIAYSLITVSNDCPAVLGASVVGFSSFLPQTLLQWLLLILVILALVVLGRQLYKKKEEPKA